MMLFLFTFVGIFLCLLVRQTNAQDNVDSDPPVIDHVPYDQIESYKKGKRTLFMTLNDPSGIDTTLNNRPRLHCRVTPDLTFTELSTETIGTCNSSSIECKFKATTPDLSIGDTLEYYWSFQDLISPTPNVGYAPALNGTQTTPEPYSFSIKDVSDAGDNEKFTVLLTDVSVYYTNLPTRVFDRQMTYYEDNDEYVFEFDTSDCGTGSSSCFYTGTDHYYQNWVLKWTESPSFGDQGFNGTLSGSQELREGNGGYLSISRHDGPGMNLIFWYDNALGKWGMVGLGDDTNIEQPLRGGTKATMSTSYTYTEAYKIPVPTHFTGTMGEFEFSGTDSQSSAANWMCVTTNGVIYWVRSEENNPSCTNEYFRFNSDSYQWSGFALGTSYYGKQLDSGTVTFDFGKTNAQDNVDSDPPVIDHVPYEKTSYKKGKRTLFMTLEDPSGIDTTYDNRPRLHCKVTPDLTFTELSTETIGTCDSSSIECKFKATTPDVSIDDELEYYWSFQDLNSPTPNVGYAPALKEAQTTPDPYSFKIIDVANAGDDEMFTVLLTDVSAYSLPPTRFFDRQMTYYEDNHEYVFEFDTSDCGTGSSSCFYTGTHHWYQNWVLKWTNSPTGNYLGIGGTGADGSPQKLREGNGGYLSISEDDGPGMNLIFWYDKALGKWGMVGLGDDTNIEQPLQGGTKATMSTSYAYTEAYIIPVPSNFKGTMGKFDFSGTGSTAANWMCVTTNGVIYWFRSDKSNPECTSQESTFNSNSYQWSGFALGTSYYGRQLDSGTVTFDFRKIRGEPDTYAPIVTASVPSEIVGNYVSFTFSIRDNGRPPSGLNVKTVAGDGPTLHYRIRPSTTWIDKHLNPSTSREECKMLECEWTAALDNLKPDDIVEYYVTARDDSANTITTNTSTVTVKNPEKMLVVEWHNMGYKCTVQLILYEGTSVFEYRYANDCEVLYNKAVVGFQDSTRSKGMTIRKENKYYAGTNPFTNNYQMNTQASGNGGYMTLDRGLKELKYYNEVLRGTENGSPSAYYCYSNAYFSTYKDGCGANIDLPVDFEYFGETYAASNSSQRLAISRFGAAYLTQNTALERTISSSATPSRLPDSVASTSRPNLMAVWWGAYSSYYMYEDSYVAYKVLPVAGCPEGQVYKSETCGCVPDCLEKEGYAWDGCDCVITQCTKCLNKCQAAYQASVVKQRYLAVTACQGEAEEQDEEDEEDEEAAVACDEACLRQSCGAEDAAALLARHDELMVKREEPACAASAGSE